MAGHLSPEEWAELLRLLPLEATAHDNGHSLIVEWRDPVTKKKWAGKYVLSPEQSAYQRSQRIRIAAEAMFYAQIKAITGCSLEALVEAKALPKFEPGFHVRCWHRYCFGREAGRVIGKGANN